MKNGSAQQGKAKGERGQKDKEVTTEKEIEWDKSGGRNKKKQLDGKK